ncbi:hypothetical protein HanIR_Chr09g0391171 [Helianthus annuus]|nr:hypothetical protein HanIR_Chr09g0391171 [Helianthus annuus]
MYFRTYSGILKYVSVSDYFRRVVIYLFQIKMTKVIEVLFSIPNLSKSMPT